MTIPKRTAVSRLLRAATFAVLGTGSLSAMACGTEPYVGTVCTFSFNFCPDGYLPADGRQVTVQQYQLLFAVVGFTYGGNNTTLFNLPDLRGRVAVGTGTSDYGFTTNLGQKSGAAAATLSANNLPAHVHPATSSPLPAGSVVNGPLTLPVSGGTVSGQTITGSVTVNALNGATAPTGGVSIPTSSANTIGKVASGLGAYYPQGSTPVAVPSTHNLAISGGSISGATASGTLKLPANNVAVQVTVGPNNNVPASTISTMTPNLGQTTCIAVQGLFPQRP